MSKNTAIEIFLRVRPTKKAYGGMNIVNEDNKIEFFIPKKDKSGYVNNSKENHKFAFDGLLPMPTKQEEVFDHVAKDVVDSALEGFNGTIFAYGQTGSGKTFTMTGGAEKYSDRGIIPRTISYIFSETRKRTDHFYQISISYIEIYNNDGYDLLDENHNSKNLADLPKVIPRETDDERIVLSNLSEHKAQNEEDALNLLFIGDTNRVVCETPKNDASTRSHCIFIVQIEASQVGSDIKTVSRLHLVDLSGSERVGKTGVDGKLLQEARYINLSLHYLEHVIICLNKKAKGENVHIPYRNSLMTLVLRDSLGGNCKTRMVATMSAEEGDIDESISTCHFAARVALIKNTISRNEAVDPGLIIERLKKENAELKAELALLKGGNQKDNLDSADIEECKKIVEDYVKTKDPSVHIVLSDRLKINECFYHFKHLFNDLARKYDKDVISGGGNKIKEALNVKNEPADLGPMTDELKRLKLLVQQRDNEIMILLNMINKNKLNDQSMAIPVERDLKNISTMDIISKRDYDTQKPITFPKFQADLEKEEEKQDLNTSKMSDRSDKAMKLDLKNINYTQGNLNGPYGGMKPNTILPSPMVNMPSTPSTNANSSKEVVEVNSMLITPLNLTTEQLMDRASCFEIFRKSYRKNEALEENKELLKEKFAKGKELGPLINNARNACNRIKNQIEELRKEAAVQGLVNNDNAPIKHPDEDKLTTELEKQKLLYKRSFEELKDLKEEIQRIQNLIERNREKLQKDFEKWIEVMMNQKSALNSTALPTSKTSVSYATSHAPNNALNQISLNQSITSTLSSTTKKVDPEVQKNLQAFYKARDDIYNPRT